MSGGKKSLETASYIHEKNPEILKAEPRPGGAVVLIDTGLSPNIKVRNEGLCKIEEQISREFRVHSALDRGIYAEEVEEVTVPNPLKDAMFLTSVAISTLMMLASGADYISNQHVDYTQAYLTCVRDDYGYHPPNVQALLNFLSQREPKEEEPEVPDEKTVRSVTRVRMGSQAEAEGATEGAPPEGEAEAPPA